MVPQNNMSPPATTSTGFIQDARLLRYQDVLAKVATPDATSKATQYLSDNTPAPSEGWTSDEDDLEEMQNYRPIQSDGIGPLLGGFDDAETRE